jgi:PAS domain S-box-containing protein
MRRALQGGAGGRPRKTVPVTQPPEDFLAGGGEMGERMRAFDWSTTAIGAVQTWPQSLRSAVGICLGSRFPIVMYWGPDCVVLYNDAYAEILGKKHPWALGRPCREVWSEIWDVIAPMLDGVVTRGEATWSDDQVLFLERRGYPEECYFSFSFSPVRGANGAVDGVFTAVIETTRRVLGERRLRTLRELGTKTADAKSVGDVCREAAAVLAADPADVPFALLYEGRDGGARAALVATAGRADLEVVASRRELAIADGDSLASAWQGRAAAAETRAFVSHAPDGAAERVLVLPISSGTHIAGALVAGVSRFLRLGGDYRDFFDLAAARISAAIANAKAYEEEKKRAEVLAELDRAKTVFFSNVSHELRTPLTLMLGPVEDMLARSDVEATTRGQLEVVRRNGRRLLKLVSTMLDFSRIEAGRMQARYEPTDLGAVTSELASVFRSAIEKAGMRLVVDCAPLREPVYVDRDMYEKIVLNLLSNALKFTLEGEIEVRLLDADGAVELSVRDTGTGIAPSQLPHVFDRFHRIEGAPARTQEGTGIGLALVQELVTLHGGNVTARSVEGQGSTFTVAIPRGTAHLPADRIGAGRSSVSSASASHYVEEALRWLPDEPASAPLAPAFAADARPGAAETRRRPRIVWADDNADMRDYVGRLLAAEHEVEAVADGEAALVAVQRQLPDLVIADVMMPKLDGFGLLQKLRTDPGTREVPVILLSARAGEESRVEGRQAGADDYVVKPFSARELLARVASQLELSRLRRESSRALRESENRFRAMADTAPAMLWITDPAGSCTFRSRGWYEFTGQTSETALGHGWLDAIHPEDRGSARASFLAANEARELFALDYRLRRTDGEHRWAIDAGRPRFDENGRFLGHVGAVIDITDRKRAEDSLREADRRKDEFLAALAHELRTPLAPLRNALEIIRVSPERQLREQARDMMVRQLGRMVRLVDDLLDVSRISRGRLPLRREPVGLADVVGSAVETVRPVVEAAGHALTVALPAEPVQLHGDLTRLAQVLSNLLDNSAKYCDRGGRISLQAERDGEEVVVRVRDDGIGIPPEALPHVFEMFSQVDHSLERSQGGLGIGLALVRSIVEMHGGAVEARSEGKARGSEFIVRLPIIPVERRPEPATDSSLGGTALAARRVLVVDDNADSAESLGELVRLMGNEVRTAHDGLEAVEAAAEFRPDLILMDVGIPGLNGLDATRRIREQPWAKTVRIVALTGWGQEADRKRSADAGCDGHLVKPVEPAVLEKLLAVSPACPPQGRLERQRE